MAPPSTPTTPTPNEGDPSSSSFDEPDDNDLEEFVRGQRGKDTIHPVRIVLAIAAVLCCAWVLVPTVDETRFHFSQATSPLEIGDGQAKVLAKIPNNTWVRADVILGNKAIELGAWRPGSLRFGPITVREVAGAPLYVEYTNTRFPNLVPFMDTMVEGRLVSFDDDGELGAVRRAFEGRLGTTVSKDARVIVLDERPGEMNTYLGAWITGVALVVFSILGILRRLRPRARSA